MCLFVVVLGSGVLSFLSTPHLSLLLLFKFFTNCSSSGKMIFQVAVSPINNILELLIEQINNLELLQIYIEF